MKQKVKNRLRKTTICTCLLILILCQASTVFGTTQDRYFDFNVIAINYTARTAVEVKDGSTPVYCKVTDLQYNNKVRAKALGCNADYEINKTLNGTSGTLVNYVTLKMGVNYSIHTKIHEDGYPKARLAFNSLNTLYAEHISGKWSPDSSGTYTHATQQ